MPLRGYYRPAAELEEVYVQKSRPRLRQSGFIPLDTRRVGKGNSQSSKDPGSLLAKRKGKTKVGFGGNSAGIRHL